MTPSSADAKNADRTDPSTRRRTPWDRSPSDDEVDEALLRFVSG
jgi:hypothetical protein